MKEHRYLHNKNRIFYQKIKKMILKYHSLTQKLKQLL